MPDTKKNLEPPVCSVCIANYNGALFLKDCLDSVLSQEGGISLEIIVHDDASTDGSLTLLEEHYPFAKVIKSRGNVGFCISNNRMVEQAAGKYVLLLNNDAALFPDALATLAAASEKQENPGILGLPQYDWDTGNLVDRGCLLDPFYYPIPNLDPARDEVAYVVGACLWIPRVLWTELGGFPEWMGSVAEDLYLGCRARLAGVKVEVLPRSGYRHRQGATLGGSKTSGDRLQTTYRRRYLSERNKTAVMMVCTPTPLMWPLLLAHLSMLLLEGSALSLVRMNHSIMTRVYLAAVRSFTTLVPCLMGIRKDLQEKREIKLSVFFSVFRPRLQKLHLLMRHGLPNLE